MWSFIRNVLTRHIIQFAYIFVQHDPTGTTPLPRRNVEISLKWYYALLCSMSFYYNMYNKNRGKYPGGVIIGGNDRGNCPGGGGVSGEML